MSVSACIFFIAFVKPIRSLYWSNVYQQDHRSGCLLKHFIGKMRDPGNEVALDRADQSLSTGPQLNCHATKTTWAVRMTLSPSLKLMKKYQQFSSVCHLTSCKKAKSNRGRRPYPGKNSFLFTSCQQILRDHRCWFHGKYGEQRLVKRPNVFRLNGWLAFTEILVRLL